MATRPDDEEGGPFPDTQEAIDPSRYFAPPPDDDPGAEKGEIRDVVLASEDQAERNGRIQRGRERLAQLVSPAASVRAMDVLLQEKGGRLLSTFTHALTTRLALARNRIKDDISPDDAAATGAADTSHQEDY